MIHIFQEVKRWIIQEFSQAHTYPPRSGQADSMLELGLEQQAGLQGWSNESVTFPMATNVASKKKTARR